METKNIWFVSVPPPDENHISESNELLLQSLQKNDLAIKLVNPLDVAIGIKGEEITFYEKGVEMSVPDLVVVRKKRGAEERIYTLAQALLKKGVAFFEPVSAGGVSKAATTIKRVGVFNTIPTLFASRDTITSDLPEGLFDYPLIVKPSKGHLGINVFKVSNKAELDAAVEKIDEEVMVQQFIEIQNEYRVMVVEKKAIGVVRKIGEGVAKNAAAGSHFEAVEGKEIAAFAEKVAALQAGVVYGVDIAKTVRGELYVIECNRAPEFVEFNRALGIKAEDVIVEAILERLK